MLDDSIDTDIAAIEAELEALQPTPVEAKVRQQPRRAQLPPQFPRTLIHHEPDNSRCIRGKWVCEQCETLIQRLPTQRAWDTANLLPHQWVPR